MTLSYVDHAGAVAVTTAAAPSYPATVLANDALVFFVASDSATVPSSLTGWTPLGSPTRAGGITSMSFLKIAAGGESGTVTLSGITGGTKGWADIVRVRSNVSGATILYDAQYGSDSTATATAFQAAGSSWSVLAGDFLVGAYGGLAATGSFSASPSSVSISHTVATVSSTAAFGARTGSNTIGYGAVYASVTADGTGVPTINGTFTGANVGGTGVIVRLRESVSTSATVNAVPGVVTVGASVPVAQAGSSVQGVAASASTSAMVATVTASAVVSGVVATASGTTHAPTVTGSSSISPPVGAVSVTATPPTVSSGAVVFAVAGAVVVAGYAPGVDASASATVNVPSGAVSFVARAPVVSSFPTLVLPDRLVLTEVPVVHSLVAGVVAHTLEEA